MGWKSAESFSPAHSVSEHWGHSENTQSAQSTFSQPLTRCYLIVLIFKFKLYNLICQPRMSGKCITYMPYTRNSKSCLQLRTLRCTVGLSLLMWEMLYNVIVCFTVSSQHLRCVLYYWIILFILIVTAGFIEMIDDLLCIVSLESHSVEVHCLSVKRLVFFFLLRDDKLLCLCGVRLTYANMTLIHSQ